MGNTLNFGIEVEVSEIEARMDHEVLDEIHREFQEPDDIERVLSEVDGLVEEIKTQIEGGEGYGTAEHTEDGVDYSAEWSIVSIWSTP